MHPYQRILYIFFADVFELHEPHKLVSDLRPLRISFNVSQEIKFLYKIIGNLWCRIIDISQNIEDCRTHFESLPSL